MPDTNVKGYQRKTATGQTVNVKAYDRSAEDITVAVTAIPGRPPMAAQPGKFANGRAIPFVWPPPPKPQPKPKVSEVSPTAKAQPKPDGKPAEPKPDLHQVLSKLHPDQAKTSKVLAAAAEWVLGDDTVEL